MAVGWVIVGRKEDWYWWSRWLKGKYEQHDSYNRKTTNIRMVTAATIYFYINSIFFKF